MKAIALSAPRRRNQAAHFSISRAISALFSARVSAVVGITATAAMWLAIFTAADDAAAQSAVGRICLAALPWAAVWAVRACRMPLPSEQEGGRK